MKKNNRGVTILEVILAMAVIMVVSVTAIMIITQFSRISSTMLSRNEVITSAENALETFKFAKSQKDLNKLRAMEKDLNQYMKNEGRKPDRDTQNKTQDERSHSGKGKGITI